MFFGLTILLMVFSCLAPQRVYAYETPAGYDDHDYQKLVAFLETKNGSGKNGDRISKNYNPEDPTTWEVEWSRETPKKVTAIWDWDSCGLVGNLDVSGFTELQFFYCESNQLTSLDVSGCTALRELFCNSNQLTRLDASGCTALGSLFCHNNQLTSLDVSGCTALKALYCSSNHLTSLNVSDCGALKGLYCDSNKLTNLDVSGCTALEELSCRHNQLTSLDVSDSTALKDLDCSFNELTSLNVNDCTVLQSLECFSNQLTNVDVSGCTALTNFRLHSSTGSTPNTFKILAIGNSFSQDALQHLYQIAAAGGADEIVLANLYIGGCSLETHWDNAEHNLTCYKYEKNVEGKWKTKNYKTLLYGLQDEEWDVITLQQVSDLSGMAHTYNEKDALQNLIAYVNTYKTNPDAELGWHMTWAYQSNSTHKAFKYYDGDQLTMYNAIVDAVKREVVPKDAFDLIIPTGTAIQNVRTSYIGDTLTRDGYHLSLNLGRYIAGLTWFHSITGWPIDDITYVPHPSEIPEEYLPIIKDAVKSAVKNPFMVTVSSYIEQP